MGTFEAETEPKTRRDGVQGLNDPTPPEGLDEVTPIPVGDLVSGRWVIDGVVGHGAMGVVCAAHHVDLGQRVAVKFLRASYAKNDLVVQRFLDEARAAAALRSEHIVRVFDIGQTTSGLPYFVMEFLEGTTLEARLRAQGPVPPELAVAYALQACEGLGEAHAAGIIHRDVKPENLFISTEGRREVIKVVDFGIAKRLGAGRAKIVTGPQDTIGSPCYMAPEQMVAPSQVDPRTDVWALGVALYQCVTGCLPFDGNTLEEVFERIQSATVAPPSTLNPRVDFALDAIVARCLRKDPRERYPSIRELQAALEGLTSPGLTHEDLAGPRAARSDSPSATTIRPRRSGPTWLLAGAAVLGAVATVAAAIAVSRASDADAVSPRAAATPAPSAASPARVAAPLGPAPAAAAIDGTTAPPTSASAPTASSPAKTEAAAAAEATAPARSRRATRAPRRGPAAAAAPSAAAPTPAAVASPAAAAQRPEASPPEPATEAAEAADDETSSSGDDAYAAYLKRKGWRPVRDVLSELEKKDPQRAAGAPETPDATRREPTPAPPAPSRAAGDTGGDAP